MFKNICNNSHHIKDFFWNMFGSGLLACQSAIFLFFIVRSYGQEMSGIVTIAYAWGTFAYTLARYGMRNYQVTDSKGYYDFLDYVVSRLITIVFTAVIMVVFLGAQYYFFSYSAEKFIIVFEIILLKFVDAFEDVFLGRYQQIGHFIVGARIMAIRELLIMCSMCLLFVLKMDVRIVFACGIVLGTAIDVLGFYFFREFLRVDYRKEVKRLSWHNERVIELLKECFPLCVGTALAVYVSNIPKYATDRYMGSYMQAIVGYLFLPIFTIALLNQFIYTPFIKQLGDIFDTGDYSGFKKKIKKQSLIIVFLSIIILFISFIIGMPILSYVYQVDLSQYDREFIVFLIGGGAYALSYYFVIPVTIIHKQRSLAIGYIIAIVGSLIIQRHLIESYGLIGIAVLYLIVNGGLVGYFIFVISSELKSIYRKKFF